MKKNFIVIIFFLFISKIYSEVSVGTGLDLNLGVNIIETDIAKIEGARTLFIPNINLDFSYFAAKESKFGGLCDVDFHFSPYDIYKTVDYKGNDFEHVVNSDKLYEKGENNSYHKNKKTDPTYSFELVFSPKFIYRNDDWLYGVGPSYTLSYSKMLFANENDKLKFSNGDYGYSQMTSKFVKRQYIGICSSFQYGYFFSRLGISFLENSAFTNNHWHPCMTCNIGIGFRKNWKFNTYKDLQTERKLAIENTQTKMQDNDNLINTNLVDAKNVDTNNIIEPNIINTSKVENDENILLGTNYSFDNMYAKDVVDIFEESIFTLFKSDLSSYDTALKRKLFLESEESKTYINRQKEAQKLIQKKGIKTIVSDWRYKITNFNVDRNMFYIVVGSKFKDSTPSGPDKQIADFYYKKLPTKLIDGSYCLQWEVADLNKALEIENQKKYIGIKLETKVDSIVSISYEKYRIEFESTGRMFDYNMVEKYDSSWTMRLPNCTDMKITIYNTKTNEVYKVFEF